MAFVERSSERRASRTQKRRCVHKECLGPLGRDAALRRPVGAARRPYHSFLNQTAFSEITEITARRALYQVYGELEQANLPRVVHALYDRAEWFVFVFDLPLGAINYRVD